MDKWLAAALDYLPRYIEHQVRLSEQPGCAIAVAYKGKLVLEQAFGHADLVAGSALTPRHRFWVASHSKSFIAAGVLKLREQRRVKLDDRVGDYVPNLHPKIAAATLGQLGQIEIGADRSRRSPAKRTTTGSRARSSRRPASPKPLPMRRSPPARRSRGATARSCRSAGVW